jgi:hypothetical protein
MSRIVLLAYDSPVMGLCGGNVCFEVCTWGAVWHSIQRAMATKYCSQISCHSAITHFEVRAVGSEYPYRLSCGPCGQLNSLL